MCFYTISKLFLYLKRSDEHWKSLYMWIISSDMAILIWYTDDKGCYKYKNSRIITSNYSCIIQTTLTHGIKSENQNITCPNISGDGPDSACVHRVYTGYIWFCFFAAPHCRVSCVMNKHSSPSLFLYRAPEGQDVYVACVLVWLPAHRWFQKVPLSPTGWTANGSKRGDFLCSVCTLRTRSALFFEIYEGEPFSRLSGSFVVCRRR